MATKNFEAYTEKNNLRAGTEVIINFLAFIAFWVLSYIFVQNGQYLWASLTIISAGILLTRLFVLQHDCGHNVFFSNHKWNNRVGKFLSLFTLAPYDWWRMDHSKHHAQSGDLEKRGTGDIWLLTVDEYAKSSTAKKLFYRFYRSAFVLVLIGPALLFLLRMRIPDKFTRSHPKLMKSVIYTNIAIAIFYGSLLFIFTPSTFLITHIPIVAVGASVGVWMFTVQHTYEDAYWAHNEEWSFDEAAWKGSSVLRLGSWFDLLTANICYHNIHHVNSRIPSYNLKRCYYDEEVYKDSREIYFWEAIQVTKWKLWSEEENKMLRISDLPAGI